MAGNGWQQPRNDYYAGQKGDVNLNSMNRMNGQRGAGFGNPIIGSTGFWLGLGAAVLGIWAWPKLKQGLMSVGENDLGFRSSAMDKQYSTNMEMGLGANPGDTPGNQFN